MSCKEYQELQRRCESRRKRMSHFMRFKPANWQTDPQARKFAKDTQAEIMKTAAQMAKHQQNCTVCKGEITGTLSTKPPYLESNYQGLRGNAP